MDLPARSLCEQARELCARARLLCWRARQRMARTRQRLARQRGTPSASGIACQLLPRTLRRVERELVAG